MAQPLTSCIDLFCGAGGLTHGMQRAQINVQAGIDLDPACKFPFEANNKAKFVEADIAELEIDEVAKLFGKSRYRILAGCAPCQPFSSYSHRYDAERDGKWALLYQFADLVKELQPDIVTMENVPAVARHRVFAEFRSTLELIGYHVWSDVVECSRYGVPQSRKRFVLLASLHGPIKLIEPTHEKPLTVKNVIGRLRRIEAGESAPRDRLHIAASLSPKNMQRMKASKPGGTWRDWPNRLVADCHKGASGSTYQSVYGRMNWDKPAPTMTTQCYGFGNGRFGHPEQDRAISLREAAIFQGFPRSYKFVPPKEEVKFATIGRLIGNAVPVDLGEAIGMSIRKHLRGIGTHSTPAKKKKRPA